MSEPGLAGVRVVETAGQIAGPYCGKLFVDGGADVVKVEPPGGDPLRWWSAGGADLDGRDSALFSFLNAGKGSVVGALDTPEAQALLEWAEDVDYALRLNQAGLPTELHVYAGAPHGDQFARETSIYRQSRLDIEEWFTRQRRRIEQEKR